MSRRPAKRIQSLDNQTAALTPPDQSLSSDQIQRWAELIADGGDRFPANLPRADQNRLAAEVRRRRRERLIRHIARVIALDLRHAERKER